MTEYSVQTNGNFYPHTEALSASDQTISYAQLPERGRGYKLLRGGILALIAILLGVLIAAFLLRDEATVTESAMGQWKLTALFLVEIGLAICGYLRLARWLRS